VEHERQVGCGGADAALHRIAERDQALKSYPFPIVIHLDLGDLPVVVMDGLISDRGDECRKPELAFPVLVWSVTPKGHGHAIWNSRNMDLIEEESPEKPSSLWISITKPLGKG
jgi:hypothetical protein